MATGLNVFMLVLLGLAVYTDLTARRIPNALTLPAAVIALVAHLAWQGPAGLGAAALGWLAGVGLLIVPFLLRGIGAGDVKLLAAVGAIQGPFFVLMTFLFGAIAGGLVAPWVLGRSGTLTLALHSLLSLRFLPGPMGAIISAGRIPYAPAIGAGAVASLALGVGR